MSEQLKQELEAGTDRLEAETVADSEKTIGEQEEKPTEGKLEHASDGGRRCSWYGSDKRRS